MAYNIQLSNLPAPMTFSAENALLGSLIANPMAIAEVRKTIRPSDFSAAGNAKVWQTLCYMDSVGEEINLETIYTRSDATHFQRNILPYTTTLAGFNEVLDKARLLLSLSMRRAIYFKSLEAIQGVCGEGRPDTILASMQEFLETMSKNANDDGIRSIGEVTNELGDILQKRQMDRASGKVLRVPTGFSFLDRETYGGFANGNLVILAARPSVGKTAFMLQMARAAATAKIPTLVMSLEMTNTELVQRMATSTGYVTTRDLASGLIDWTAFETATGKFTNAPLWFTDKVFLFDEIVEKVTTAHKQGKCDALFIDYLQLIASTDGKVSLNQQVSAITKRLKRLAKECEMPVVVLSQLSRDMSKEGREPQLHDLRDSGSIEQDADIVIMLDRLLTEEQRIRMFLRKNRQGELGRAVYEPRNCYSVFEEVEGDNPTEAAAEEPEQPTPLWYEKD